MALPVALQLYSVRGELERDFKGTIEKVKEMGYQGVELSGLKDDDNPNEVKKILDGCGLKVMSSHVPFEKMLENPQKVFEAYTAVGCSYIVIPWLNAEKEFCEENFDTTMQKITDIGKAAKQSGLTLLYHNHNFEFKKRNGKYLLDMIYSSVKSEYLKTQLDTCWVKVGGEDPAEYIRKYSGRAPLVHLKDFSGVGTRGLFDLIGADKTREDRDGTFRFRPIGQGVQDFADIIKASEDAGAEWLIVEQDESPDMPPMVAAEMSRRYLLSLGY